jgi:hypothetical protein
MIYMWFTGINYYKLAVEKDRESIFTTITNILKPGLLQYALMRFVISDKNNANILQRTDTVIQYE